MNKIKDVYAQIAVEESVVTSAIENAKKQKIRRFPVRRVTAIAAGFVIVLLLVGVPIFALNQRPAFSSMAEYDEAIMEDQGIVFEAADDGGSKSSRSSASSYGASQKKGVDFELIGQYPALMFVHDLAYRAGGLSFGVEQAYYDGEYLMIAFRGSYISEEDEVERVEYVFGTDERELFEVNGEAVVPAYGSFYLVRWEDEFIGVLTAYVRTDAEQLDVKLSIPYLAFEDQNGEVLSVERKPVEFVPFSVGRSGAPVSFYQSEGVSVLGVTEVFSSPAGTTVRYHAGRDCEYNPERVRVALYDESGNIVEWIESESEGDSDGGVNVTARFDPTDSEKLTLQYFSDSGELIKEEELNLS